MELVKKRLAQTREVSSLLAGIFTDEYPDESMPSVTETSTPQQPAEHDIDHTALMAGLDETHSKLLRALASSPSWTAEDFHAIVEDHGLMPSGAMETLNEAAFDACDEALLEGEDMIHLNDEVLQDMLS